MSRLLWHCLEFMINTRILCNNTSWTLDMHVWNVSSISCQQNADFWSDGSPERSICVRVEDDASCGDRFGNVFFPIDNHRARSAHGAYDMNQDTHLCWLETNPILIPFTSTSESNSMLASYYPSTRKTKSFCMIQWQSRHMWTSIWIECREADTRQHDSHLDVAHDSHLDVAPVIMTWKGKVRTHKVVRTCWRFQ